MPSRISNKTPALILIPLLAVASLHPWMSSALALLLGAVIALSFGNPYLGHTKKMTHRLLTIAVMGLGAGMNLGVVGRVGMQGVGYTIGGITFTFLLGFLFQKILKTENDTSLLITAGTAICGGSAIAALAPTIRAKSHQVSVALGIVFMLNALALFIFPPLGHLFHLTEAQFGLWSALAIHDTSSVVGAALSYGAQALQIATTVKLARALWIIPLTLLVGYFYNKRKADVVAEKPKRPWFILGFLLAAALVTWMPILRPAGHIVELVARRIMVVTLFFIGSNLTAATLRSVGLRPFIQGFALWICVASITLSAILFGLIPVIQY